MRRSASTEQEPPGGGRGAETVAGAGALEAALEVARLHREPDAYGDLVAGNDSGQHIGARSPGVFGHGKRGRPGRNTGMQHCADMSVVGIETGAERDIEEGRVLRIEGFSREQHVRGADVADEAHIAARPVAPRQTGADRAYPQVIKQEPAEFLSYFARQCRRIDRSRERRQRHGGPVALHHCADSIRPASLPYLA